MSLFQKSVEKKYLSELKNVSNSKKADGVILNVGGDAVAIIELKSRKTPDLDYIEVQAFRETKIIQESGCKFEIEKLSLSEESEWLQFFNEQRGKAQDFKVEIEKTDNEIDQMVYELYGLSEDEIAIVEGR